MTRHGTTPIPLYPVPKFPDQRSSSIEPRLAPVEPGSEDSDFPPIREGSAPPLLTSLPGPGVPAPRRLNHSKAEIHRRLGNKVQQASNAILNTSSIPNKPCGPSVAGKKVSLRTPFPPFNVAYFEFSAPTHPITATQQNYLH